jgi:hypothetical protein
MIDIKDIPPVCGFLIWDDRYKNLRGPNEGSIYGSQDKAERALKGWPGIQGIVVQVKVTVVIEEDLS